jgi:DNA polymerase I-like protein with 3'-5' exonuclease and polymerase domains
VTYQTTLFSQLDPDVDLDPNAILISDPRWLECLIELQKAKYIGIDAEFYEAGKGPWGKAKDIDYWKSAIRLIQVGLPSERVLVFNLGGLLDNREELLSAHKPALAILKQVVESKTVPKIGMNLSCEYLLLRIHLGMKMRCMRDIMLCSQLLLAGVGSKNGFFGQNGFIKQPRLKHSMAAIAERLGLPIDKTQQQSDWAGRITNAQLSYAARDAIIPIMAFQKLGKMIKEDGLLKSATAECSAQPAFCECSYNGLPVDVEQAKVDLSVWEQIRDKFWAPFKELFPGVNPSSPKQVAEVLGAALDIYVCGTCGREYDPLQQEPMGQPLSVMPETDTCSCGGTRNGFTRANKRDFVNAKGSPTTADDVLAPYSNVWYVNALLEGRSTSTCLNWLKTAVEHARDEGDGYRIRTNFKQIAGAEEEAGKGMGRSSASRPINTQNSSNLQPEHERAGAPSVRRSIKPALGRKFIVADLSQAHLRIAAQVSQDPILLRDFNAGHDAHLAMSHRLLEQEGENITFEQVVAEYGNKGSPKQKRIKSIRLGAKTAGYASLNMAGAKTMVKTAATMPTPIEMSEEKAQQLLTTWRELYFVLAVFQKQHVKQVNSYSHTFSHLGLEGEYGESRGLTGRRLFLIKEYNPPRQWPDGNWSKARWSVKGTDAVSSIWMSTESDIVKYAMGLLVEDFDAHPEWDAKWANMAHDEVDLDCKAEYALEVAKVTQQRFHAAMRWGGIIDIPVDETGAKAELLIKADWSAK